MGGLVGIVFWLVVAAIVIVPVILRHRQRMAAIAKGVPLAPIAWGIHGELKASQAHLRRGLILALLGGGILVFFSISIPTGFTGANEPIQIIIFVGVILLAIGIAEIIYYRLTRPKAAPPTEKETPPSAGRRLVASGDDDAEKKTPQIDADKRR